MDGSFNLTFHGGRLTIEAGNNPNDYESGVINSWGDLSESCDISESATFLVGDSAENCISLTAPYTTDSIQQELRAAYDEGKLTHNPWYLSLTANYTVTFATDGGSAVDSQTVPYGEAVRVPVDPTRAGYTFAGWYLNGKVYDFTVPVTEDLTLTAKWTANEQPEKTVQFDNEEPSQTGGTELPKTGDSSNLAIWGALLLVSGSALVGTAVATRRKKHGK